MLALLLAISFVFIRADFILAVGQNGSPNRDEAVNRLLKQYWLSMIDWPTAHTVQPEHPTSEQQRLPHSQTDTGVTAVKQEELPQKVQDQRDKNRKYASEKLRRIKADPERLSRVIQQRKEYVQRKKNEYQEKYDKMTPEEQEAEKLKRTERNQRYISRRRERLKLLAAAANDDDQAQQDLRRRREKKRLADMEYRKRQDEKLKIGLQNNNPHIQAQIRHSKEANRKRVRRYRDRKQEQLKKARWSGHD